jgi:hypothetical protein
LGHEGVSEPLAVFGEGLAGDGFPGIVVGDGEGTWGLGGEGEGEEEYGDENAHSLQYNHGI